MDYSREIKKYNGLLTLVGLLISLLPVISLVCSMSGVFSAIKGLNQRGSMFGDFNDSSTEEPFDFGSDASFDFGTDDSFDFSTDEEPFDFGDSVEVLDGTSADYNMVDPATGGNADAFVGDDGYDYSTETEASFDTSFVDATGATDTVLSEAAVTLRDELIYDGASVYTDVLPTADFVAELEVFRARIMSQSDCKVTDDNWSLFETKAYEYYDNATDANCFFCWCDGDYVAVIFYNDDQQVSVVQQDGDTNKSMELGANGVV